MIDQLGLRLRDRLKVRVRVRVYLGCSESSRIEIVFRIAVRTPGVADSLKFIEIR